MVEIALDTDMENISNVNSREGTEWNRRLKHSLLNSGVPKKQLYSISFNLIYFPLSSFCIPHIFISCSYIFFGTKVDYHSFSQRVNTGLRIPIQKVCHVSTSYPSVFSSRIFCAQIAFLKSVVCSMSWPFTFLKKDNGLGLPCWFSG